MDHDRALVRIAGGGQHRRLVAPRDRPRLHQHPMGVDASEEAHFPATRFGHFRSNLFGGRGRETQIGRS